MFTKISTATWAKKANLRHAMPREGLCGLFWALARPLKTKLVEIIKKLQTFFFVTEHRANTGFDASLMMWHSTVMNETKLCSEHPNVVNHGKTVTIPVTNQPGGNFTSLGDYPSS